MTRTVIIKFEGQLIRTELPLPNLFTGEIALRFHWREGKLMRADATKSSSASIESDLPTLQRGDDSASIESGLSTLQRGDDSGIIEVG